MISFQLKGSSDTYCITIPKEITRFTRDASIAATEWRIKSVPYLRWFWDYWVREFQGSEVDMLYGDLKIYEYHIDEITQIIALPKFIWCEDRFLYIGYKTPMDFDNYVELWTWGGKYFDKKDFLYLISLIKKKILEAKEKNEILVFSGD